MSVKSKSLYLLLFGILLLQACVNSQKTSSDNGIDNNAPLHLGFVLPQKDIQIVGGTADSDGNIYFTARDGILYAIKTTGDEIWKYNGNFQTVSAPFLGKNGAIHLIADRQKLVAVDKQGREKWVFDIGGIPASNLKMAPDGTIYIQVFDRDPEVSGYKIYRVAPDGTSTSFPLPLLVYMDNSTIDSKGNIHIWETKKIQILSSTGETDKECKKTESRIASNILTGPDDLTMVVEENFSSTVEKLNAFRLDCSIAWNYELTANGNYDNRYRLISGGKNILYVGEPNGVLNVIDPNNGNLLWKSSPNLGLGNIISVVKLEDGLTYAGGSSGKIAAFDVNGKQVWQDELFWPSAPYGLKALPDNQLFLMQGSKLLIYTHASSIVYHLPANAKPPSEEKRAKEELVSFILDFIIKNEIGETADFLQTSGSPWVDAPVKANLIIYAPALENPEQLSRPIDSKNPLTVWWYEENKLIKVDNMQKAIDEYQKIYVDNASSSIFAWGRYGFGILQIGSDYRSAEVYIGASCGPLCGHGVTYKLKRSPSGEWWIYDAITLWMS